MEVDPRRDEAVTRRLMIVACMAIPTTVAAQQREKPPVARPPSVADSAKSATKLASHEDSVTIRVVNTDLRAAVQVIGQYLDRPVIFTGPATGNPVTLETPRAVPRRDVARLLRSLLDSQNYEFVDDSAGGTYRVRPRPAAQSTPSRSAATPTLPQTTVQRPTPTAPELFVIPLRHAKATDVASTINALFGHNAAGVGTPSAPRTQTLADELRANQIPPVGEPLPQSLPGTAGRPATLSGDMTIVADPKGNNLLIRSNRADFALVQAAVNQLDVRPYQVLIEVLIVEARTDYSFNFGVNATAPDQQARKDSKGTIGGSLKSPTTGLGDLTMKLIGITGYNVESTIAAAEGHGDVRILSRPVVLAANNERAEVVVGSQRPFVQVARTLPTDAPIQDQIVQYKDVGTKLSVTPTISVDGSVQLDVSQEVSSATTETAFNAPVISNRSVRTKLLVRDGQTAVLGGLRDKERNRTQGGIPFLSGLPFIGGLFGHYSETTNETELYIFITPRVIRNDEEAAKLTDPLRKRADNQRP